MNAPLSADFISDLKGKVAEYTRRVNREKQSRRGGLIEFVRYFWHILEPSTPMVEGEAMEAICEHLEAVTFGEITRLLITVPPGFSKSLMTSVFWPLWEQSAMGMPHMRYVCFSYSASLTERDNTRFRDLAMSPEFQELWGDAFTLVKTGETQISNNKTGWKLASSVGGVGTGQRGTRVILDDPHSIKQAESELIRTETTRWFREAMSNRLNDMATDAIIVIMQRSHDEDVAGVIINGDFKYCILSIEMELDTSRETFSLPNDIGWVDWRTVDENGNPLPPEKCEGALAWPERFPRSVCEQTKIVVGPFGWAAQYQQSPTPRSGGILKRLWWALWDGNEAQKYGLEWNERKGSLKEFPHFELIVGSLDTAYGAKQENDYTAMTVFGVWLDLAKNRRAMLMYAWAKRLPLHGLNIEAFPGEAKVNYDARKKEAWGIVEWVSDTCRRYKVQRLLIEDKTKGRDVSDELRRLYARENWGVELVTPTTDKVSRAHSVVPLLADGSIWAPQTNWSEMVLDQCARFPKAKNDDLCFAAGTLIATRHGDTPIERIVAGDEVLTPIGWRRVISSGFTGVRQTIVRCGLVGTANHPIFVLDNGFIPLDTVTKSSPTAGLSLCSLIKTMRQRQLNLMGLSTGEWEAKENTTYRNQRLTREGDERRGYILQYGSSILARLFLPSMKYITRIATPLISALIIWSAYRRASIGACLKTSTEMLSRKILHVLGLSRVFGINQMRVANGIAEYLVPSLIQFEIDQEKSKVQEIAFGAERNFNIRAEGKFSAATCVPDKRTSLSVEYGQSAIPTMRPVFNLSVFEAHCYYANGILVHNCDTVTQFLNWARANEILVRGDEMSAAMDDEMSNFRQQVSVAESYGVLH